MGDKSLLNVKKQDNIYKIKASLFLNDQKNLNLEDYVLVTEANGLKFANAKNQFVLNYNEIQLDNTEIFFDYSSIESNEEIRSEFPNSLKNFASINQQETKKGFFMLFKKAKSAIPNSEKIKAVYLNPSEVKNIIELKKNISTSYLKTLKSDDKYWNYQLFNEKSNPRILHWSQHVQEKKHFLNDVNANIGKERLTINDNSKKGKKYSFRYEQIMNCQGTNNQDLQTKLKETFNDKSIIPDCCVSYEINWKGEQREDIFCSTNLNQIRCKADIEIFKKTIMDKCISAGVKGFFKNLSEYEFDMEHYLAKATNLNKLKNYRTLKFLDDLKILNIRNTPHFSNVSKYLDLFSKFFDKYYPLLQKESKSFDKDLTGRKSIIDIESKKGKIILSEDDIYTKVIENINSQNTETISEDLKQFLK